jgi:hypothetical protein
MSFLDDWLARQSTTAWPDLTGTSATLRLPLREPIVNAAIEALVLPRVSALRRLSVSFLADQRVDVVIASGAIRFLPAFTVTLDLDPVVVCEPTPIVRMHLRRGSLAGALGSLAAGSLPPGVRLTDGLIEVEVATLIGDRDTLGLLPFLRSARVETAPGLLWLLAEVRV